MKKSMFILSIVFLSVTFMFHGVYASDNIEGPSTRESIIEYLEITGAYQSSLQSIRQTMDALKNALNKMLPNDKKIPDELWANIIDEVSNELDKESYYNLVVPTYEKYFTPDDIKELVGFYKSSVGRKFLSVLPNIMKESGQAGQEWAKKATQRLIPRIKKRLQEMGYPKEITG